MLENLPLWNYAAHQNQVLRKKHSRLFTKIMAMCSAVLATDVKHGTAPEEQYWSEKLILRGPTKRSVPALGIYK